MTSTAIQSVINRHFPPWSHPYRHLERTIASLAGNSDTILDIGCGRTAPVLVKLQQDMPGARLLGIDPLAVADPPPGITIVQGTACGMGTIESASIDTAFSRSVMEHVHDVEGSYLEVERILKPGGHYVLLTPNFLDYISLASWLVPNSLHGRIVSLIEGRAPDDVFPTFYRSNTKGAVRRLAAGAGLDVVSLDYLNQYPSAFTFNDTAFRMATLYHRFLQRFGPSCLMGWILGVLRKPPA